MDSDLQRAGCTPALSSVMGGRFAQQVICKGLPYRSEREEEFLQISVDVRGMGGLERSLESYVKVGRGRGGGGLERRGGERPGAPAAHSCAADCALPAAGAGLSVGPARCTCWLPCAVP